MYLYCYTYINICIAIEKRSHDSKQKINTKNEANRYRATTFAIAKFEERKLNGDQYC